MDSIWTKTARLPRFDPLSQDMKTDVLIIGGGLAGLLCAYLLQQQGVDYLLVEARRICGGITENTTAKITSQHGLLYSKLIRRYGEETARIYLEANEAAVTQYRDLCRTIDCGFEDKDAFVYSVNDERKLEDELLALEQLRFSAEFETELPLPFPVAGAVRFPKQGQFHPLRFVSGLAKDLHIFENTKVLEWKSGMVVTNRGTIFPKKTIAATHFPMFNKHGGYFLKLYQHRSYVMALEHAPQLHGMYVDEAEDGLSFRNDGNLLLLGGGGHRTGKQGGSWNKAADFVRCCYPQAKEIAHWGTQDCMTLDGIPYIGQYSRRTPELYVATGFNKWGMTSAMVAAGVLTDLVLEKDHPYAQVFSPARTVLHPQLAANAVHSVTGLLTPTTPRCPHMGCALKYNRQEHSWDCPCHGSRFTDEGQLINNPATDDMKK